MCKKCKFSCAKEQRLKRSSNFLFHYSPPYFILYWIDLCVSRNPQRLCQFLRTRRLQWQGVKFMWPLIPCNPKMTPDFYGLCKFNPTGNFSLSYIDIRSRFSGKYSLWCFLNGKNHLQLYLNSYKLDFTLVKLNKVTTWRVCAKLSRATQRISGIDHLSKTFVNITCWKSFLVFCQNMHNSIYNSYRDA